MQDLFGFKELKVNLSAKVADYLKDAVITYKNPLIQELQKQLNIKVVKGPKFPYLYAVNDYYEIGLITYRARTIFTNASNCFIEGRVFKDFFVKSTSTQWLNYNIPNQPLLWGSNVVIYDENKRIFCGKKPKKPPEGFLGVYSGLYDLPGGKTDLADFLHSATLQGSLIKAGLRELKEETKLLLKEGKVKEFKVKTFLDINRVKPEAFLMLKVSSKTWLDFSFSSLELNDIGFKSLENLGNCCSKNLLFAFNLIKS